MIGADGNRIGPVEASELVRYGLTPSTLVWREGLQDWIPASSEPGLAAYLAPAASTPPTPQQPIAQPYNSSIAEGARSPQFRNPKHLCPSPTTTWFGQSCQLYSAVCLLASYLLSTLAKSTGFGSKADAMKLERLQTTLRPGQWLQPAAAYSFSPSIS